MPRCDHCGRDDLTVRAALALLAEAHTVPILRVLFRIEKLLITEGATMAEIDDRIANLQTELSDATTSLTGAADDVTRALADLTNAIAGKLTDDERAKLDALDSGVQGLKAAADAIKQAVDTADPAPAPPVDNPGDGTTPTA